MAGKRSNTGSGKAKSGSVSKAKGKGKEAGSARGRKSGKAKGAGGGGVKAESKAAGAGGREKEYIPDIVVFACNWCSYAGADNAGVNRIQHSPHFRIIRTMCSGRVTPAFVLKAFKLGADGVLVSGCHFGDCHYIFGNYKAVEQFEKTQALVRTLGLDEKRVRLEWVSAAEGSRWGDVIDEFVAQVADLGPSPLNNKQKARTGGRRGRSGGTGG
jgi:coenzyme F420-reducing hydrogenase delta subunit